MSTTKNARDNDLDAAFGYKKYVSASSDDDVDVATMFPDAPARPPSPPPRRERVGPNMTLTTEQCALCKTDVILQQHSYLRHGACGHAFHLTCCEPLLVSGRRWCYACPIPGPEVVDAAANDINVRAMLTVMRENRAQGRMIAPRANSRFALPNHPPTVKQQSHQQQQPPQQQDQQPKMRIMEKLGKFWGSAEPVPISLQPCKHATCTLGADWCLHAWTVSPAAARVYVFFDGQNPLGTDVKACTARLRALLQRRINLADLLASGGSTALMACCQITAATLVDDYGYTAEDVLAKVDWPGLMILRWEPLLLRNRDAWPVICLVDAYGGSMAMKILSAWSISFSYLVHTVKLRLTDVAALGFTSPMLVALGMNMTDLCAAAIRDKDEARVREAVASIPGLTLAVFSELPVDRKLMQRKPELCSAMSSLAFVLDAIRK